MAISLDDLTAPLLSATVIFMNAILNFSAASRPSLILLAGMFTVRWPRRRALRIRVSMSAMGSVITIVAQTPLSAVHRVYQLALRTPGMSPSLANSRKQIRQTPNFRM